MSTLESLMRACEIFSIDFLRHQTSWRPLCGATSVFVCGCPAADAGCSMESTGGANAQPDRHHSRHNALRDERRMGRGPSSPLRRVVVVCLFRPLYQDLYANKNTIVSRIDYNWGETVPAPPI